MLLLLRFFIRVARAKSFSSREGGQGKDELHITRHRRFPENDPDLRNIHMLWEQALRKAVQELPLIQF